MHRNRLSLAECAWSAILAVLVGLTRLVPHAWNLTPVGAIGLYGGSRMPLWLGLTLPLGILAGTDLALWMMYTWPPFNPVVYASFLGYVLLGYLFLQKPTALRIVGVSLLGSLQFFLITNFAIWLSSSVPAGELGGTSHAWVASSNAAYPQMLRYSFDLSGLLACYGMAIPFYRGTLLGDLIYPLVLFGVHRVFIEPLHDAEVTGNTAPVEVQR